MRQRQYTISATLIVIAVALPLRVFGADGKAGYYQCPTSDYDAAIENLFGSVDEAGEQYVAVRIFYPELHPETEIVIAKVAGAPAVLQRVLTTWLWPRVFRRSKPTSAECRELSKGVKVETKHIRVSSAAINELLASFNAIDLRGKDCVQTICHLPDATGYEVRAGRKRARLIDTSETNLVSDNQILLEWVLKLRRAVREAEEHTLQSSPVSSSPQN